MRRFAVALGLSLAASLLWAQTPEPDTFEGTVAEGQKALAEHRWDDAARAYEKLRELSPDTAEIHAQLGMIYFQLRDFGRAVPPLRQALKMKPDLPNVDALLAMSLSELGKYEEALPGLQRAFDQTSDATLRRVAGLQLQRAWSGLGQDDKAVEVGLRLTRLYPDDPEILYHAGRLFSDYAYRLTMHLADVAPASVWMHQAAGEANESMGSYDAALEDYRKVLALSPDRPGIHYRLGRVYLARARAPIAEADAEANAAREFEAELKIDPTNADAAYELGQLRRKAGDLDRARALFAQAVERYPEYEPGQVGLGQVLIAQGHPDLALPHLHKATELDPEDDVAFFHLWQAQRALGHVDEEKKALAEFQRLRALRRERERMGLLRQHVVTEQELKEKQ